VVRILAGSGGRAVQGVGQLPLDLRVRIPPETWMFVLCGTLSTKANARTIRTKKYGKSTKTEQKNPDGGLAGLCCAF
jgi:hypothetical protein